MYLTSIVVGKVFRAANLFTVVFLVSRKGTFTLENTQNTRENVTKNIHTKIYTLYAKVILLIN